jgi:SAM-dependent methyltransferase
MRPITPAEEQRTLWNGTAGSAWIDAQALLDGMFQPLQDLMVDTVRVTSAQRVLDVGCGTGSTTLAIARRLGARGQSTGIDISAPMIDVARMRARQQSPAAEFIVADAQTHDFEAGSFDAVVSRFGVMFFADFVAAFSNLRRSVRASGGLHVIVWRAAAENPFMTVAERAAAPLLPDIPPRRPDAPGQFALADASRVRGTLEASGWTAIDLQAIDIECAFPEKELVPYMTRLGPLGMVLKDADEATRRRVIDVVRPAFDPFVRGAEVRFNAACWHIHAEAPHA